MVLDDTSSSATGIGLGLLMLGQTLAICPAPPQYRHNPSQFLHSFSLWLSFWKRPDDRTIGPEWVPVIMVAGTVAERTAGVECTTLVKDGALLLQTVLIVELEAQVTNGFDRCFPLVVYY